MGVCKEVGEDQGFKGVVTKRVREEEGVWWVLWSERKIGFKSGEKVLIIAKESLDGERGGERIEVHAGGD